MSEPTFQIPKDVIEPIIKAQVSAAVASALGDKKQIIQDAICSVLQMKVNNDGSPDRHGYSGNIQWIQWMMEDSVRKVTKSVMEEELGKYKESIKKQIVEMLQKKNSPLLKQLVQSMTEAIVDPNLFKYRMKIEFDK